LLTQDIERTWDTVQAVFGADRASLDFIWGRPGQTADGWADELQVRQMLNPQAAERAR